MEAKQKASYNFLKKENQTSEYLTQNDDFLNDARGFLTKRGGYSAERLQDSQEVYEQFMEHFRYQNVNEVTAVRDLEYASNAKTQDKEEFARLIDLYDTMEGDGFSLTQAKDYAGGILSAPSTYLGLITGGVGKLASTGSVQISKIALKQLLASGLSKEAAKAALKSQAKKQTIKEIGKSATIGATVEGSVGFGQALAQEETRVETGQSDEYDMGRVALTTGATALGGGIAGGIIGKTQAKQAMEAAKLKRITESSTKAINDAGIKEAKRTLALAKTTGTKAKKDEAVVSLASIKERISKLTALDPVKTRLGREATAKIAEAKKLGKLTAGLPTELFEQISAAALDLSKRGGFKLSKDERITAGIQKALSKGDIDLPQIQEILSKYNLTKDTFSLIYKAEISDAGKTLGFQGNLSQQMSKLGIKKKANTVTADLVDDIGKLDAAGVVNLSKVEAEELASGTAKDGFFRGLDRLRLGLMTSQIATTMRNFENAGFRTFIDAGTRQAENIIRVGLGKREFSKEGLFGGVFDVYKAMLNPYEAQVVRQAFQSTMPDTATKLFREAADLEASLAAKGSIKTIRGVEGYAVNGMAFLGNKANVLNTFSDNVFKQAMLTASLKRRLSDNGMDLFDIMKSGKFAAIPESILKDSVEDSLNFVYQSSFSSKGGFFEKVAAGTIKAHRDVPFVVSAFMPFPRYIANQFKFVYEHAPILGMIPVSKKAAKGYKDNLINRSAKQVMGLTMMTMAYGWRQQQGHGTYWNEFKDNTGKVIDGRATYGPFAPYMLAADILFRHFEADPDEVGTLTASVEKYRQDTLQAMLGSTFRTGYGVYALDKLMIDLGSGASGGEITKKLGAEFIANIVNTYTIPAAIVKDFYSQFDAESRKIPETRLGDVDFWDIVRTRGFRAAPDFGSDTALGAEIDDEYDVALRSPFRQGDLKSINPLEKQLFGFNKGPKKNIVEREMAELNFAYYDLYKKHPNELIDRQIRKELSNEDGELNLVKHMQVAMANPLYKSKNRTIRKGMFKKLIDAQITKARVVAKNKIQADEANLGALVTTVDYAKWNEVTSNDKNAVASEYRNLFPLKGGEDTDMYDGKNIRVDADRIITLPSGKEMPVMLWAISRASSISDI
mgnify:CR=1 FL=1|tara:strand:+ start:3200 stop:6577 length:3378 start_codon:yes stop_codon:yes gene_type:complete